MEKVFGAMVAAVRDWSKWSHKFTWMNKLWEILLIATLPLPPHESNASSNAIDLLLEEHAL